MYIYIYIYILIYVYLYICIPKMKDRAYVINVDEYKSIGTYWITLIVNSDNVTYFNSFGVECFLHPKL